MRHIRRWLRGTASVALLLTLTATTTVWHVDDDDRACNPILSSGTDGRPQSVAAARQQLPPQHCVLCHWNRGVRSVPASKSVVVAHGLDVARLSERPPVTVVRSGDGLIPGRSPPA